MENDAGIARRQVDNRQHLRTAHAAVDQVREAGKLVSIGGLGSLWGAKANGKSVMDMLSLAAERGKTLELEACGPDAEQAIAALSELVEAGFHMDDEEA